MDRISLGQGISTQQPAASPVIAEGEAVTELSGLRCLKIALNIAHQRYPLLREVASYLPNLHIIHKFPSINLFTARA